MGETCTDARNRYPRQCYEMLRQLDKGGRNTWGTNFKRLLYWYGFGIAWITQDIGNINVFIAMFKERLTESFNSNTMSDINTSPKALCCKLFKSALNPELHLSVALPQKCKLILANFRCSCHLLNIEQDAIYTWPWEQSLQLLFAETCNCKWEWNSFSYWLSIVWKYQKCIFAWNC